MEKLRVEFNFHQAATILLAIVQSLASQVEPMSTLLLKTSLFLPITIYTKSSQTKSINIETGRKEGGQFKPHKTHRSGLSVDFMTPVVNSRGKSVHLPTYSLNKLGYTIEFDTSDKYNNLSIDYEAMAAHIVFFMNNPSSATITCGV